MTTQRTSLFRLTALLRLFPTNLLSRLTGIVAAIPLPFPLNFIILRMYALLFGVDRAEAQYPLSKYLSLQSFFTRALRPDARPVDSNPKSVISPVDGTLVRVEDVSGGTLLQAKGWHYPIRGLLGDARQAARYLGGSACTLYLSPADYHRIHMPLAGTVESLCYLPGRLFPVNRFSLFRIENLFLLNERLILHIQTQAGKMAMVLVGATNVGKIRVRFDDVQRRLVRQGPYVRSYNREIFLDKGEEVGCFELGSTVILLFEKERVCLSPGEGVRTKMGEAIGFLP